MFSFSDINYYQILAARTSPWIILENLPVGKTFSTDLGKPFKETEVGRCMWGGGVFRLKGAKTTHVTDILPR